MRWKSLAAEIERTATAKGRAASGRFSVEGLRLIERAAAAGVTIEGVLIGENAVARADLRSRRLLDRLEKEGVEIVEAPEIGLAGILEGRETGAMAALLEMPASPSVDAVIPERGAVRVLVALDVDDPGNLGALIRTALASGADAFVVTGPGDPYHPRAVRISRGSLFRIPVLYGLSDRHLFEALRARDVQTVGAVTRGGTPLPSVKPVPFTRWAVCLGSEAFGLSDDLIEQMNHTVTIPMPDGVDSHSVNAAAAILLYALRQPPS